MTTAAQLIDALDLQLTDEQRAVVFGAPDGPAVVIAGAGSGKTAVMAARIAVLVATGRVVGEEVLGLTFTRKAAAELAERVDGYLRAARRAGLIERHGANPEISTYHSFAQRFVREHGIWVGIDPDLRVESDFALLPLAFETVVASRALAGVGHRLSVPAVVSAMRRLDSELAEHMVDTSRLRDTEERRMRAVGDAVAGGGRDSEQVRRLVEACGTRVALSRLVDEYRTAKALSGVMDYADMMRLAQVTATGSDEAVRRTRERYRAVLLDEYQDTSVVQRLLLQSLFGDGHSLLAVGDPKQSIYGFRGAAAASMQAFAEHFPAADGAPARVFALTANFRSGPGIVAVANDSAASRRAGREGSPGVRLTVGRQGVTDAVEVHAFRALGDEQRFVVEQVAAELAAGRAAGDVVVLARSNDDVADYAEHLNTAGIPAVSSDGGGLFELPEVRDLLAVLAVAVDPGANEDLMRLLVGPRWRLGLRDLDLLGRRARELAGPPWRPEAGAGLADEFLAATSGADPVELPSLVDAVADPGELPFSEAARARFAALHAELDDLARHAGDPVPDLLARILRTTGMEVEILLGRDPERHLASVSALMSHAAQFQSTSPGAGPAGFLRLVRLARQSDADPGFAPPVPRDCVRVMTVHKAKGLQADVVLLPGFTSAAYDTPTLRDHWTTAPAGLPDDLRGDRVGSDLLAPGSAAEVDEIREVAKHAAAAEAERLIYVALTRARTRLVVSSHWWAPGKVRPRPPSVHLLALAESPVVEVGDWEEAPADGARNPLVVEEHADEPFPAEDVAARDARRELADRVARVRDNAGDDPDASARDYEASTPGAEVGTFAEIARWDDDIDALIRERRADGTREAVLTMPESLSVTALQHYLADPDGYAADLRRPMPGRPSPQARRGTRFHEWVARRWDQRALIDAVDLAEDRDLDRLDDAGLESLRAAFDAGVYADRRPAHIEYPFSVLLAGLPVNGRIDAVYADGDGWEVVDWKTSGRPVADAVQLAVYRLAWAKIAGVHPDRVSAAFYYVPTGLRVVHTDLPDEAALAAALRAAESPGS